MNDHEADLLEIAGTHGWRALKAEILRYLEPFEARLRAPATAEFDFVTKEVASGVVREMTRFVVGIEQTMDSLAKQQANTRKGA